MFPHNRYQPAPFLDALEKLSQEQSVTSTEPKPHEPVELYLPTPCMPAWKENVLRFLQRVAEYDNMVQDFCANSFQAGKHDAKNYEVSLAWIDFEDAGSQKAVMGYWGKHVNLELRAVFLYTESEWQVEEIYWQ